MENSKLKFILASASPRRKELVGHLKVPFEVLALNIPEESTAVDPVIFSTEIAKAKGNAVFEKLKKEQQDNFFIVSADTIVVLGKKIYGKPVDRNEARQFLSELQGKTHSVFTAVSVILFLENKIDKFTFSEETKVTFNKISAALMESYLDTGDSLDKAGAYGIQNGSLTFISKVDGDYANVVGFPLARFIQECETFLQKKFPQEDLWLNLF
jgi:septum formation protein